MKIIKFFISPLFMGVLFIVFAASMAAATFIENDYGSSAAYNFVYDTRWFELILLLLAINLIGQVFLFRLYRSSKLTIMLFHLSFVIMLAGAAITRYTGWEGTIHIREGEEQNLCYSSEKYLGYKLKDSSGQLLDSGSEKYYMSSRSADNFRKRIRTTGNIYTLVLSKILPNASEIITEAPGGAPLISIMASGNSGRETFNLKQGDTITFSGITIGFDSADTTDVVINSDSSGFFLRSKYPLNISNMMTQQSEGFKPDQIVGLMPMQVITVNGIKIVPQEMSLSGVFKTITIDQSVHNTGKNAFIFDIYSGRRKEGTIQLWDNQTEKVSVGSADFDGNKLEVSYGPKATILPFYLKLNDFVLERYPGSNSPSGYKSDVVLIDQAQNVEKPFTIFMNNVLKYKGYRFYQSSYDADEMGTILSVNHDLAGMAVSYTGYGLLFLFIVLSLLNRKSAFNTVTSGFWSSALRKTAAVGGLLFLVSGHQFVSAQELVPDKRISEEFGKILVQDQKGRTKPLLALSNDILRKVTRENKFEGMSSMQVFLGIYFDFDNWKQVPLIRVSNKEVRKAIGIIGNFASFGDIVSFDKGGSYKLSDEVNKAYSKAPGERTKYDKEIMKVDERVNIVYMIYSGGFLKIFPLRDGTHNWGSPQDALKNAVNSQDSLYLKSIIPMFGQSLQAGNEATAKQLTQSIIDYQKKYSGYDLPTQTKTGAELLYYRMMIFERLFPFYASIGLVMLVSLIVMVIRGNKKISVFVKVLGWLLFAGFLFHTFGLGLRWYISGHSPMSNGYESMIFISWATLLAGLIFSRKSPFALSATAILASMTLMVAHLSFMDPEITNLVPVLKSYWLTLHVSVITGSYGFLGLGAILGIINMILLSLSNRKNLERISTTIDELTVINFKTLVLGLYFLTIGTFLGAVWANESWGRYWGWDPKETWSLITIVIYSLVTHSRLIPGMKDIYTFNLLSFFAFSSVLMTYFGVNYYLSGLHSYAGGESVPVPAFVYISVIVLIALSSMALMKYRKWEKG
jgi:cytochrome c-type biogenesis protein CcsB